VKQSQKCPPEVLNAACEILHLAAISIRFAALTGKPSLSRYCAPESSHIHNLPNLIRYFDLDRLRYYLDVEVASYLDGMNELEGREPSTYDKHWEQMRKYLSNVNAAG
jgi:hypothetical protein